MTRPAERYQLLERLGSGGLGVVHRALDRVTGNQVALKIMPRPHGGTNLRDEFVALARLRHPNIVSVLDYGLTDGGQEYFTMELVLGPPLAKAVGAPESAPFHALIGGVLDALSAVHARGMVHADVKPNNVLVDGIALSHEPPRAARLADFGLATSAAQGPVRGTFVYAAPEAWAGRVDARSDLYSLGVVIYELVTGRPPWTAATSHELLAAQRQGAPQDPRMLAPQLSAGLAELIVALCDPAPGARPQSADEVRDRLGELAKARGVVGLRSEGETRSTPRQIGLGGAVIGRERELEVADAMWRDARAGRGRAVVMVGEEGIGKTRLLAEIAVRVQLDGGDAVRVSAAARAGTPWAGVDELVRALLAIAGDAWTDEDGDVERRRALAPLAAGHGGDTEGWYALAEAVADLVLTASRRRACAILVDDAHAATPPVAQLLEYLTRAVADAAAMLVVAVRPAEPVRTRAGSGPVALADAAASTRLIAAVRGARGGARLDLPPLDRTSTFELAAAAVGTEVGYALGDSLHRAAGGNPGHALHALELMARERRLRRAHGAWVAADDGGEVPLPESARSAALSRLAALAPIARATLRAAAVLGYRFDRDLLAAVLGHPDRAIAGLDDKGTVHGDSDESSDGVPRSVSELATPVSISQPVIGAPELIVDHGESTRLAGPPPREIIDAAVADAVAARVLTADPAAGTFELAHPQLAAVLAEELAADSRALVQLRGAATLERRAALGLPVQAAPLVRLLLAAGDRRGAQRWARRAIDELAAAGDPRGGVELGRELLPTVSARELAPLAERIGELAAAIGELGLALEHYAIADAQPGAPAADHVRLALAVSELHRRRGDTAMALALLDEALEVSRVEGLGPAAARCHLRLGSVLAERGAFERAGEHADAGLVIARVHHDRAAAAELGRLAATLAMTAGDRRRAVLLLEEALADATAAAEPRLTSLVLHALGRSELQAGEFASAAVTLERAIAQAAAAGDVAQRARALGDLGRATYHAGQWGRARRAWERARQLWERLDDRPAMAAALIDLGELYADLGMGDEARTTLARAIELASGNEQACTRAEARAVLGHALAEAGDHAGARAHLEEALAELEALGARNAVITTRRRLADLALRSGRPDEAVGRALDNARDAKDAGLRLEEGQLYRISASATRLTGDADSAAWFLGKARELLAGLGARRQLALLDVEDAEQAVAAGHADDAEVMYARAEATFADLGARGALERVRARRRDGGARGGRGLDLAAILGAAGDATAAVDVETAAAVLLERVLAASSFERGFVLSLDDDGRPRVTLRRTRTGARGFDREDAEFSGTIVRKVASTGAAIAVGDAAMDAALREQRSVIALGLRRIVCAPLRVGGRVGGVVYLDATSVLAEGADLDLRDLEALAPTLALLLERSRLAADAARMRELMSILAHEIRNPLASILGYTDMCLDPDMAPELDRPDALGRIRSDAERMARLVENVLEMTRHERGNTEWSMTAIDLAGMCQTLIRSVELECERRGIRIALEAEPRTTCLGNKDRLMQVVSNLVANAIKFANKDGSITLMIRREVVRAGDPTAPPAPATELRAWVPAADGDVIGDFVRLEVRDTGPGMSPELRNQIFAKFTQGPGASRARGIGLGLYISREIVRRHGGSIWVESELGKGATFIVRIPVAI